MNHRHNVRELLRRLGEDPERGGLVETPERFIKAMEFYCSGYAVEKPEALLKVFEDGGDDCDEMILQKGIPVWSLCEHHLAPFFGVAHIAYIPKDGRIVGLSKLTRLVDVFMRRLQVQERLTTQIANTLATHLSPCVGVQIVCRHSCMEARGVQTSGTSTTSQALRGAFKTEPEARAEFLSAIRG
tara:strand:+ start:273 stop:827 length:555 start_codon:yes stop_codon:yes gene_type:complete